MARLAGTPALGPAAEAGQRDRMRGHQQQAEQLDVADQHQRQAVGGEPAPPRVVCGTDE